MENLRSFLLSGLCGPCHPLHCMSRNYRIGWLALLCFCWILSRTAVAATPSSDVKDSSPGAQAATALSQITGVAISPLVGTAGVGAWRYFKSDASQRAALPWYAQPWFWVPALLIAGVCALKDAAGPVVPTVLKKPVDVLEVFENKISGLIATGAIVPIAMQVFQSVNSSHAGVHSGFLPWAALDLAWFGNLLMVPFALVIYAAVWMVSHTTHVIILISPFGTLDAAIKAARAGVLASVVGSHWLGDFSGAVWAVCIIIPCLFLAGWAFRFTVFGTVFAWDMVTFASHRQRPVVDAVRAFTAHRFGKAPRRTFGHLRIGPGGALQFQWRPWLVFPPVVEVLPPGSYFLSRGLLHRELALEKSPEDFSTEFHFPPRCNGHDDELVKAFHLTGIRDHGLRLAWAWLTGQIRAGTAVS